MSANIIRTVTAPGQWQFGNGAQSYIGGIAQVEQNINARLNTFLGECFFATNVGIDWFTYLGTPGLQAQSALNLAVTTTIANTQDVLSVQQISINVDSDSRLINIQYQVQTVYGPLLTTSTLATIAKILTTESGINITTESGVPLEQEQNV